MLRRRRAVQGAVAAGFVLLGVTTASAQAPVEGPAGSADAVLKTPEAAADPPAPPSGEDDGQTVRKSTVKLRLKRLRGGRLTVGKRFIAKGTLRPFAKGERVTLYLRRGKKTIARKTTFAKHKKKGSNLGKFQISKKLVRPGRYTVQAVHKESPRLSGSKDRTRRFRIRYPDLDPGNRNSTVRLFNRLLARKGYVNDEGKAYDAASERAVLAFHKVNKRKWSRNATPSDFKKLAKRKGGYRLKHPNSGKHVEADLSRQVMVLAKGDKVKEIYHVSSGAAATPTPTGTWRFTRKEPGYNNVEMYYSVYWYRGYATHGYKSVPSYPASHGCLRNPPADSIHIYNWIDIGDLIHIYR